MSRQMGWLQAGMLAIDHAASHAEKEAVAALDYAVRMLVNTAKTYAPYRDISSDLRKGYGHKVVDVGRNRFVGVVYNRMEYAPNVEFTPSYWVISGAFHLKRTELLQILGSEMDMSMLNQSGGKVLGVMSMGMVGDRFKAGAWLRSVTAGKGTSRYAGRSFVSGSFINRTGGKWK